MSTPRSTNKIFEELKGVIRDLDNTVGTPITNLNGVISKTALEQVTRGGADTWLVAGVPNYPANPDLAQLADKLAFRTPGYATLNAVEGVVTYVPSLSQQGQAHILMSSVDVTGAKNFTIDVDAVGYEIAIYVNRRRMSSGRDSRSYSTTLTTGRQEVYVVCYGGVGRIAIKTPASVSMQGFLPIPNAPAWSEDVTSDYLTVNSVGNIKNTLRWVNDPFASAWTVYRAVGASLGVPISATDNADGTFDLVVTGDVTALLRRRTQLFSESFYAGTVISTSVATNTTIVVELAPETTTVEATWEAEEFFYPTGYSAMATIPYNEANIQEWQDSNISQSTMYLYRITARDFLTGQAESDYSITQQQWVDQLGNSVLIMDNELQDPTNIGSRTQYAAIGYKRRVAFHVGGATNSVRVQYTFERTLPAIVGGSETITENYVIVVTPDTTVQHFLEESAVAEYFEAVDDAGSTLYDPTFALTITPYRSTDGTGTPGAAQTITVKPMEELQIITRTVGINVTNNTNTLDDQYDMSPSAIYVAQEFSSALMPGDQDLYSMSWYLYKDGTPTGPIWCELRADDTGDPDGTIIAVSEQFQASDITDGAVKEFVFPSRPLLSDNTTYWALLVHLSPQVGANFYSVGTDSSTPSWGQTLKYSDELETTWNTLSGEESAQFVVKYAGAQAVPQAKNLVLGPSMKMDWLPASGAMQLSSVVAASGGGGAGASTDFLDDILDVDITTVGDNDILGYDSTSGDWLNQTAAELGLVTSVVNATNGGITVTGTDVRTLSLDVDDLAVRGTVLATDWLAMAINGGVTEKKQFSAIDVGIFNDDNTYVTAVLNGTGIVVTGGDTVALDYVGLDAYIRDTPNGERVTAIPSTWWIAVQDDNTPYNVYYADVSLLPFVEDVLGGAGLTASGTSTITLDVGEGAGILVNTNDVAIDFSAGGLTSAVAATGDFFAFYDTSLAGMRNSLASAIPLSIFSDDITGNFYDTAGTGLTEEAADTPAILYTSATNYIAVRTDTQSITAAAKIPFSHTDNVIYWDTADALPYVSGVTGTAPIGVTAGLSPVVSITYGYGLSNVGGSLSVNPAIGFALDADDSGIDNALDELLYHDTSAAAGANVRRIQFADLGLSNFLNDLGLGSNVQGDGISLSTTTVTNDTIAVRYTASATNLIGAPSLLVGNAATTDRILVTEGGASAVVRQAALSQLPFLSSGDAVETIVDATEGGIAVSGTATDVILAIDIEDLHDWIVGDGLQGADKIGMYDVATNIGNKAIRIDQLDLNLFDNSNAGFLNSVGAADITAGTFVAGTWVFAGTTGLVRLGNQVELQAWDQDATTPTYVDVIAVPTANDLKIGNATWDTLDLVAGSSVLVNGAAIGTVTSVNVTAGALIDATGGPITTSGSITIDVDLSELTDMTAAMISTDEFVVLDGILQRRKAVNEIPLSLFDQTGFTWSHTHNASDIDAGTLLPIRGGTGVSSPGAETVLIGQGASSMTTIAATIGTGFLRSNGTIWAHASIVASDVPNLDAAKITTGTFANDRISSASVTQHQAAMDLLTIEGLVDPNADRILFWDDVGTAGFAFLDLGTNLSITGTTLNAAFTGLDTAGTGLDESPVGTVIVKYAATSNLVDGAGAGTIVGADLLLFRDDTDGVVKKAAVSSLPFTNNAGTVTSVGGTGTVNGLTLTGTVTTSGNLTLGGTFSATVSEISDLDNNAASLVLPASTTISTFAATYLDETSAAGVRGVISAAASSHTHAASDITVGTFGNGDYTFTNTGDVILTLDGGGAASSVGLELTNSSGARAGINFTNTGGLLEIDSLTEINLMTGGTRTSRFEIDDSEVRSLRPMVITGAVNPAATNTYNLGNTSFRWGTLYAQNLDISGGYGIGLNDLTDVTITAAATGEFVRYNGSAWVDSLIQTTDITSGMVTQHEAALTILESQITDANIYTRVGGTETVTGSWRFDAGVRLQHETGDPFTGVSGYSVLYANSGNSLKFRDGTGTIYTISTVGHAHAASDITSGTFTVARGGTGVVSPTSGNLLVGAGISPMTLLAPGAAGGHVRSNGTAWVRASGVATTDLTGRVTLAQLPQIATSSFLGRITAATGNVEVLTATQSTSMLNVFTTSLKGLAPSSGGGTTNYLRADGTWAAPAGSGDITRVNITAGTGLGGSQDTTTGDHTQTLNLTVDTLAEKTGALVGTDRLTGTSSTTNFSETISAIPLSIFSNDSGWTSNAGTVTSVTGGTGISSTGGATPSLALTVDELAEKTGDVVGTDRLVGTTGATNWAETISAIPLSAFNNDLGGVTALNDLSDVTITAAATGEFIRYSGSAWVDTLLIAGDIPNLDTAKITTGTFADARISQSSVTAHQAALSIAASQVTTGTFGTGDYTFPSDLTITDNLIVSGTGPHAIGAAILGTVQVRYGGSFTSDGSDTTAFITGSDGALTGAAGDTTALAGWYMGTSVTTQTATESISVVAQMYVREPQITNNLTGTITSAASLYIADAPTEGASNYAIYAPTGLVSFGGNLDVGAGVDVTGNITVTGTVDGVDIAARDHDAVTLAGTPDYITLSGQVLTRNQIDLTTDVTGDLPLTNVAQIVTDRFLGRTTAATGDIEVLTPTQATAMLDVFTSGLQGVVPSSGGGTTNFLRADGTWAAAGGANALNDLTDVTITAAATGDFLRYNGSAWVDVAGVDAADVNSGTFGTGNYTFPSTLTVTGTSYIGDTANGDVTLGLTINQGTATDHILALKQSTVAHGFTTFAETDTFGLFQLYASTGGVSFRGVAEWDAPNSVTEIVALGGAGSATKTNTTKGLIDFVAMGQTVGNALTNVNADVAIATIRARVGGANLTRWLVDEDGDTWQSGSLTAEGLLKSIYAGTIMFRGTDTNLTDLSWDIRIADPSGNLEIRSITDAGTTVLNALQIAHATGTMTVNGNIVSTTDSTDDLGTSGVRWANLWVDNINGSPPGGASALNDLTDVTITAANTGDFLRYSGSAWVDVAGIDAADVNPGTFSSGNWQFDGGASNAVTIANSNNGSLILRDSGASGTSANFYVLMQDSGLSTLARWGLLSQSNNDFGVDISTQTGAAFHVLLQSTGYMRLDSNSSGGSPTIRFQQNGTDRATVGWTDSGTKLELDAIETGAVIEFQTQSAAQMILGASNHGIGTSTVDYYNFRFGQNFTSGGASNRASLVALAATVTGAIGDTNHLSQLEIGGSIVTQGTDPTITTVANQWIYTPSITKNVTTITNTAALYIEGASTVGTNNYALWVDAGRVKIDGDAVSGLGLEVGYSLRLLFAGSPHAIGNVLDYCQWSQNGSFVSGGGSSFAAVTNLASVLTGADGDTTLSVLRLNGSLITQTATNTITVAASLNVSEPQITDNLTGGGTITNACSVYIANAPTEGVNNYALMVDSGLTRFDGSVYINHAGDANVTTGLVINQGTADDQIMTLKSSSDVVHGLTNFAETDTYAYFNKVNAAEGGLGLTAIAEDAAVSQSLAFAALGGTANTTKTTAGIGLVDFWISEHTGANALANITADGTVFSVRARVGGSTRALWLVDEDGDYFYDGADGGAFDDHDDLSLIRAFAMATASKDVVRSEFDEFLQYNESDLVELGILGDTVENGGLVNGAQLQRLLVGAAWQSHTRVLELEQQLLQMAEDMKLLKGEVQKHLN